MDERILQIVLRARDEASAALKSFSNSLGDVQKGSDLVKGAVVVAGGAIVAAGAYSVKAASDFQSSMNLIQTNAGASAQELQKMSQAVLDMAGDVGTTPEELATGLYHIESAGFRGAQALNLLKAAAEGAKVGNANLEDTTQALISLTASHIKGITSETQAMGELNAIVGSGDMRMEDLASAMSTGIAPAAAAFGLSINDVGAAMATLTDNAVPPVDAATRLRMTFSMMGAPSTSAAKSLEGLGLSATQLADDMRSGGLLTALQDLQKHLTDIPPATESVVKSTKMTAQQMSALKDKITNTQSQLKVYSEENVKAGVATDKHNLAVTKTTDQLGQYQFQLASANTMMKATGGQALTLAEQQIALARAFGGGQESATILTLLGQMDRLKSKYSDIAEGTSKFGAAWDTTSQSAAMAFAKLGAQVQVLAIDVGNRLLPTVTQVANYLANNLIPAAMNLYNWVQKNQTILTIVAGIITAVVLPALIALEIQTGIKNVAAVVGFIAKNDLLILSFAKQTAQVIAAIVQMTLFRNSSLAMTVVTQGSTVAVWAMNAALYANPIGLVIIAIAALTAGIILAYTHITVFRNFVNSAWNEVVSLWNHLGKLQVVLIDMAGPLGIIVSLAATLASHFNDVTSAVNNALSALGKIGGSIGNSGVGKAIGSVGGLMGFADGGYVPQTGLAVVHQGEFVMSKSMLSGQRGVPSQVSSTINNNQPVVIYATVNSDIDMNLLGNKVAFAMRNSR